MKRILWGSGVWSRAVRRKKLRFGPENMVNEAKDFTKKMGFIFDFWSVELISLRWKWCAFWELPRNDFVEESLCVYWCAPKHSANITKMKAASIKAEKNFGYVYMHVCQHLFFHVCRFCWFVASLWLQIEFYPNDPNERTAVAFSWTRRCLSVGNALLTSFPFY